MATPANPTRTVRRDTLGSGDRGGRGVAGSLSNTGVSADEGGDSTESDTVVGAGDDTTGAVRRCAGGGGVAGGSCWRRRAGCSGRGDARAEGTGLQMTSKTGSG